LLSCDVRDAVAVATPTDRPLVWMASATSLVQKMEEAQITT